MQTVLRVNNVLQSSKMNRGKIYIEIEILNKFETILSISNYSSGYLFKLL